MTTPRQRVADLVLRARDLATDMQALQRELELAPLSPAPIAVLRTLHRRRVRWQST